MPVLASLPHIFDPSAMDVLRKRHRLDPEQIRLFRKSLCKNFRDDRSVLQAFPWLDEVALHSLTVHQRFDSQLDGATKLVLRTATGMLIETVVLRIDTGRTTLCVSSQVGCGAACDFCATGKMGVAVNLSAAEILDQVLLAGQMLALEDRQIRNIVFMGMGEPFHNEANVFEAIGTLLSRDYFNHPPKRILVSSVGVADAMLRCVEQFPQVGLVLSLHSVRQSVREQLIPLAKKYSLNELRELIVEINRLQSQPVMIEYLMLAGLTDSAEDASQLIGWLKSLHVHVNLIPFNAIEDSHLVGSDRPVIDTFSAKLKSAGLKTTTRYSLGSDIGAACGQLVQQENRRVARLIAMDRVGG